MARVYVKTQVYSGAIVGLTKAGVMKDAREKTFEHSDYICVGVTKFLFSEGPGFYEIIEHTTEDYFIEVEDGYVIIHCAIKALCKRTTIINFLKILDKIPEKFCLRKE